MVRTTDGILPLMTGSSASDHSDVASPPSLNENHFFHAANSFQSKPQQTEQHTVHYQFNQPSQQQQHHQQVEPSGQKFSSHKNPSSILPVDLCANVTTFPTQDMLLRVITLNCWGLRFFSKHRQQRIKSIAQHLKEQEYDIVFLQELWCQSDFEQIRSTTGYKFAHYFKTSSLVGSSGLAIFARWSPETIHFEPYCVNGTLFRPDHGDYFAGKGVAYVRIDVDDLRMHLFCTHLHAQYDEEEQLHDMYSVHRICQAYQLSKFINLATENTNHCLTGFDLIILAGDLNTTPGELPFKLLMSMTGLVDCAMHRYSHDVKLSLRGVQDITIDEDLTTCGHHSNSFTVKSSRSTRTTNTMDRDQISRSTGKRIDFILYKLNQSCGSCKIRDCSCYKSHSCHGVRVECLGKDPSTGLSFSDHQPVSVRLIIKKDRNAKKFTESSGDASECAHMIDRAVRTLSSRLTYRDGRISSEKAPSFDDSTIDHRLIGQRSVSTDAGSPVTAISSTKSRSKSTSDQSVQTTTCNSASSMLDILPPASKSIKHNVMSEKLLANNLNPSSTTVISTSNVEFRRDSLSLMSLNDLSVQHLQSTYQLLEDYLKTKTSLKVKMFFISFLAFILFIVTGVTCYLEVISFSVAVNIALFTFFAAISMSLVMLIVDRLEITALKGVQAELACLLYYSSTSTSIVN